MWHYAFLRPVQMSLPDRIRMSKFESLDYENSHNHIYREFLARQTSVFRRIEVTMRWLIMFLIGWCTGFVAFGIDQSVKQLAKLKFDWVTTRLDSGSTGTAFVMFVGISCAYVAVSTVLVNFVEPAATGSGIPEIKAYLNGTAMPNYLYFRTLLVKVVGVVFSVIWPALRNSRLEIQRTHARTGFGRPCDRQGRPNGARRRRHCRQPQSPATGGTLRGRPLQPGVAVVLSVGSPLHSSHNHIISLSLMRSLTHSLTHSLSHTHTRRTDHTQV